ncbi:conserved hypothetical protein [Desulfovibrionales bacterium]
MGLVKCLDCGWDISDQAPHCIHCGRPKDALLLLPQKSHVPLLNFLSALCLATGLTALALNCPTPAACALSVGLTIAGIAIVAGWLTRR